MIEFMNISNALYEQLSAMLDLMQSCDNDCVDIKSLKTAAEMCSTMLEDLNGAIDDVYDDWKNGMLKAPGEVKK